MDKNIAEAIVELFDNLYATADVSANTRVICTQAAEVLKDDKAIKAAVGLLTNNGYVVEKRVFVDVSLPNVKVKPKYKLEWKDEVLRSYAVSPFGLYEIDSHLRASVPDEHKLMGGGSYIGTYPNCVLAKEAAEADYAERMAEVVRELNKEHKE